MKLLIKNGYIIDPISKLEGIRDILIEDACISVIGESLSENADQVIDAKGFTVMPGFIDLHVHLREPGYEHKETICSGTKAAAAGGFTTICPMPNTQPVMDSGDLIENLNTRIKSDAVVKVIPIGAVTMNQEGLYPADITGMVKHGVGAISEDGKSVMNSKVYKDAMIQAKLNHIPVFAHCEDKNLVCNGVLNAGYKAKEFGVNGITSTVEDTITIRDILLANEVGVPLHLCHCSTKMSVKLVEFAKQNGIHVTAEACPHHFTLSEDDITAPDGNYKMNPPLRTKEDMEAIRYGIKNGIIDVIATDHAPHAEDEKKQSLEKAPFGIVGLETAFSLSVTELVKTGLITPMQLAEKLSSTPARILSIDQGDGRRGTLSVGAAADIAIVSMDKKYTIQKNAFYSMGKNTPFDGREVYGTVEMTIVDGVIVYQRA